MDLTLVTPPSPAALPLAEFKAQLRLAKGFEGAAEGDAELTALLNAAIASIEGRVGKALLQRSLKLTLRAWRWPDAQPLPLAPVSAVSAVRLRDAAGVARELGAGEWRLELDRHSPRLAARGAILPSVPRGGVAEIEFVAGFGANWAQVPADLAQAVLLLGAELYHARGGAMGAMPLAVSGLIAPWLPRRLSLAGGR